MVAAELKTNLYGKTVKQKQVSEFTLTERIYSPFFRTPNHAHESALFCLVLKGNYTETYGLKKRECLPSTVLFHASGDPHAEYFHEKGGHSFIVEIEKNWIKNMRNRVPIPNISANFKTGNLPLLGAKLYKEFKQFDSLSPLIIEGLVMEITGETARQYSHREKFEKPGWLLKAESYLQERFSESFSLKDVAEYVGIHPVYLAQTFRKFNRTTVGNYVRSIRLENARRQLIETDFSLTDISYKSGFSDQSHFTRLFKREFGTTPKEYRQNSR